MTQNPSDGPSFLPPELQAPAAATDTDALAQPQGAGRLRLLVRGAAIVATGLVAGAFGISLIQGGGSASPAQVGTAATSSLATGQSGSGPQLPGSFGSGREGGPAGETRLLGSLTAVAASSITVTQSDGTATTIPVSTTTDIELDGRQVALPTLRRGTTVLVHVLSTTSGASIAERILAGSAVTSGPAAPPPGDSSADPGTTGGTGTTTARIA